MIMKSFLIRTKQMLISVIYCIKMFVLPILLFHSAYTYAGGTVRVKGRKFIILPFAGAIWQHAPFGDLAIGHPFNIHYVNGHLWHTTLVYSKLGAEFNFNFKDELWAPKVSSEIDYKYFGLRANVEDYISSGKNCPYFTPEFGLTLAGFITVAGGYNKPFNQTVEAIPPFRLSLYLMIPFTLSGE